MLLELVFDSSAKGKYGLQKNAIGFIGKAGAIFPRCAHQNWLVAVLEIAFVNYIILTE